MTASVGSWGDWCSLASRCDAHFMLVYVGDLFGLYLRVHCFTLQGRGGSHCLCRQLVVLHSGRMILRHSMTYVA